MKTIILTVAAACFAITSAHAGGCSGGKCSKQAAYEKMKAERKAKRTAERNAIDAYLEPKDSNNDGSLTLAEFISNESNKSAAEATFDKFNKNGDRYLTKREILTLINAGG